MLGTPVPMKPLFVGGALSADSLAATKSPPLVSFRRTPDLVLSLLAERRVAIRGLLAWKFACGGAATRAQFALR